MHRTLYFFAKVGLTLPLLLAAPAAAALIRPDAAQSFPDLSGDIVGTQTYVFNPATNSGTFTVKNAPSLLAIGPKASNEVFVTDLPDAGRSQVLQFQLDANGKLLSNAAGSFSISGQVVVNGATFSGVLLEGTPTKFGWASQNPDAPTTSIYDVNVALTGGKLRELYGPDAYIRIVADANSTFNGTFTKDFAGLKALTNVRGYNAPPAPVPEPSTLCVLLACGGAGILYKRSHRVSAVDLSADD